MLHFLRKLRKKELKTAGYLKYAFGEIVLVVIGILIALSINNYNQELKENSKASLTYSILTDELEKNLTEVSRIYEANQALLEEMEAYLKGMLTIKEENEKAAFVAKVLNYNGVQLNFPTMAQELGPNRVIKEDTDLSEKLKSLSAAHSDTQQQLKYLIEFWTNQSTVFLVDQGVGKAFINTAFNIGDNISPLANLYGDEAFDNILSLQYVYLRSYNFQSQRLIRNLESTITYVRDPS